MGYNTKINLKPELVVVIKHVKNNCSTIKLKINVTNIILVICKSFLAVPIFNTGYKTVTPWI